jgi:carboxyl-terminal processing protease
MMRFPLAAASVAMLAFLLVPAPRLHAADKPAAKPETSSDTYRQLDLFGQVFERVRADYVDEVSDQQLVEAAISGMLSSLDPHSSYMNAKNFQDLQVEVQGQFGGLGLEVTMENGVVKVVSPIDDTPAAQAGLKPNDLIVGIDGEPVQGMTLTDAVGKMRGPVNSSIKLSIKRGDTAPFDVTMKRAVVKVQSVKSQPQGDDIGYIRISSFNEQTDSGVQNAIKSLQAKDGSKLAGIVLDLRNNPGGLLEQAIAVVNDFVDKGEIVSTRGRRSEDAQRYDAKPPGDLTHGLPMVVLINGGSASASEIVAGALQDHHRAILLGTRSFGKGSVQTIIQLQGHGAMRLTTARYYTPSGRSIQAQGIDPDIVVEAAKIQKINEGLIQHEADLRGALKNTDPGTKSNTPAPAKPGSSQNQAPPSDQSGNVDASVIGTTEDYQLARAIDMLRGVALFGRRPTATP